MHKGKPREPHLTENTPNMHEQMQQNAPQPHQSEIGPKGGMPRSSTKDDPSGVTNYARKPKQDK